MEVLICNPLPTLTENFLKYPSRLVSTSSTIIYQETDIHCAPCLVILLVFHKIISYCCFKNEPHETMIVIGLIKITQTDRNLNLNISEPILCPQPLSWSQSSFPCITDIIRQFTNRMRAHVEDLILYDFKAQLSYVLHTVLR